MKIIVNISRVLVGALFIFSGLVKAIDPLGLAYKMQEFFEVWGRDGYMPGLMNTFNENALMFSIIMIALAVLGIALLIGWRKNITTWLLLLLIVFFTFLTSFVLFSGKIAACGCFGDCIPLTPIQTFTKDLILLVLIIIIIIGKKHINPIFKSGMASAMIILISLFGVTFLQFYVLKHLPVKDCLPYKPGNNILQLRKKPKDAIEDVYEMLLIYEKGGVKKDFKIDALPDSTWTFVDQNKKLIKEGKNNKPLINDFSMKMSSEIAVYEKDGMSVEFEKGSAPDTSWQFVEKKTVVADSTEAILSQPGEYYLFFIKEMGGEAGWSQQFKAVWEYAKQKNRRVYIVTADTEKAETFFNVNNKYSVPVLTTDVVAIKTAARANPTLFFMKGPVIQDKWSWADMTEGIKN